MHALVPGAHQGGWAAAAAASGHALPVLGAARNASTASLASRTHHRAPAPAAQPPLTAAATPHLPTPPLPTQGVKDIWFSNDGRRFVSTGYDKKIRYWDTETGAILK